MMISNDPSVYYGSTESRAVTFAEPPMNFTIGGVVITKDGITYRGETVADAGAVHRALLEVLTGVRQLPAPIAHLRWWACQINEGHGNIGHEEGFEVCEPGAMSDDRTPAFPVYAAPISATAPIPMILHCPQCHVQHIDEPDERTADWTNPPHRSHLCHGCGHIWRPADVPTEGVRAIQTKGSNDSLPAVGGALVAIQQAQANWPVSKLWEDVDARTYETASKMPNYNVRTVYAAPAGALVAKVEYVPIAMSASDKVQGWHPNDKTPNDPACQKALDARGDDRGQGLDPYWKWGFRAGWQDAAAAMAPTQERWLEIGQAVERACEVLPEGFDLHIELERHAGSVRLYLPDDDASMDDFEADTFGGKINAAIDLATKGNGDTDKGEGNA